MYVKYFIVILTLLSSPYMYSMEMDTMTALDSIAQKIKQGKGTDNATFIEFLKKNGLACLYDDPTFLKKVSLPVESAEEIIRHIISEIDASEKSTLLKSILCHDWPKSPFTHLNQESFRMSSSQGPFYGECTQEGKEYVVSIRSLTKGTSKKIFTAHDPVSRITCLPTCMATCSARGLELATYDGSQRKSFALPDPVVLTIRGSAVFIAVENKVRSLNLNRAELEDRFLSLEEGEKPVYLFVSPEYFIVVGNQGGFYLFDSKLTCKACLKGSVVKDVWYSEEHHSVIVLRENSKIDLYRIRIAHQTVSCERQGITPDNFKAEFQGLCFTPNGDLLCSRAKGVGGALLKLRAHESYEQMIPLPHKDGGFIIGRAHPDGCRFVTLTNQDEIVVWEKNEHGKFTACASIPALHTQEMFFTPDGSRLVLIGKDNIRFSEYFNSSLPQLKTLDLHHAFLISLAKNKKLKEVLARHATKLFSCYLSTLETHHSLPLQSLPRKLEACMVKIGLCSLENQHALRIVGLTTESSFIIPFSAISDEYLKTHVDILITILKKGETSACCSLDRGTMKFQLADGSSHAFSLKQAPSEAGRIEEGTPRKSISSSLKNLSLENRLQSEALPLEGQSRVQSLVKKTSPEESGRKLVEKVKLLVKSKGSEEDYHEARECLLRLTQELNKEFSAWGYILLAKLYYFGWGVEKSDRILKKYLKKAHKICWGQKHLEEIEKLYSMLGNPAFDPKVTEFGKAPLYWACRDGQKEVVQFLIDLNVDINAAEKYGDTPLHCAAERGQVEVIKLLIENGAYIKAVNVINHNTPLHLAADHGHSAVAEILIGKGASADAIAPGYAPLHGAVKKNHREVVKILIAQKANLDIVDTTHYNYTPLHYASDCGYQEIVAILLANKADVKLVDAWGNTALHLAAKNGHEEVVKLLLKNGASKNIKNTSGKTPYDCADNEIRKLMQ